MSPFLVSNTVPVFVPSSGPTLTLRTHIHCNSRWQPARELGDPQELECSGISTSTGQCRRGSNDALHTFSFSVTWWCHSPKGSGSFWSPNLNRHVKSSVEDFVRHQYYHYLNRGHDVDKIMMSGQLVSGQLKMMPRRDEIERRSQLFNEVRTTKSGCQNTSPGRRNPTRNTSPG